MKKHFRLNAAMDALSRAATGALFGMEILLAALIFAATAPFVRERRKDERSKPEPYDPAWDLFLSACEEGTPEHRKLDFEEGIARDYHMHAWRTGADGFAVSALSLAIASGSIGALNALVHAGAPIEERDLYGRAALAFAAGLGRNEACSLLIALGARIHPSAGIDPLCSASQGGHPDTVRFLLASGSRPRKAASFNGFGALSYACRGDSLDQKHLECIKILLAAGADPREARDEGTTALMWACDDGSIEAIELLLSAGARPHARRTDGADALQWSFRNRKRDPKAAMAMAALARTTRKPRRDGRDDLMFAAQGGMPECVEWALTRGGDVHARDAEGNTALHYAVSGGSLEAVAMLLAAGAALDAMDRHGSTPMARACQEIDPSMFEALALAGADPLLAESKKGVTPLARACERGWIDQVETCFERGLKHRFEAGEGERICSLAEQAHPCGSRVRDYFNYLTSRDEKAALLAETPEPAIAMPRAILRV